MGVMLKTMKEYTYKNITSAGTVVVATGKGILHTITVNGTAAGAITVEDGLAKIATIKASVAEQTFIYDCAFANNLKITTAAASDITITWAQ